MPTKIVDIPLWATTGTKTDPSSAFYLTGYEPGTQVAGPNLNYLTNDERVKSNEIIDKVNEINTDRSRGQLPEAGNDPIITKLYGTSASQTNQLQGNANFFADANEKVDLCIYFDPTTNATKLLVLDSTDGTPQVHVYDAESQYVPSSPESSSGDLSGDLPTGASQSWQATSFCSDGTTVYVILQDTNVNPNETHQIQAWDIDGWTVKSGWASNGTTLPGTGTVDVVAFESAVEVVSTTQIATANSWKTGITASTDAAVSIINMSDGAITSSGAGDHPGTGSSFANRLCSDGTNIYYAMPTADGYVCSIRISDATNASGTTNGQLASDLPRTSGSAGDDIICIGDLIISSDWLSSNLNYWSLSVGYIGTQSETDTDIVRSVGSLAYDGIKIWTAGAVDRNGVRKSALLRIDPGMAIPESTSAPGPIPILDIAISATFGYKSSLPAINDNMFTPVAFDGTNIWLIHRTSGATYTLFRLPKAVMR